MIPYFYNILFLIYKVNLILTGVDIGLHGRMQGRPLLELALGPAHGVGLARGAPYRRTPSGHPPRGGRPARSGHRGHKGRQKGLPPLRRQGEAWTGANVDAPEQWDGAPGFCAGSWRTQLVVRVGASVVSGA